MQKLALAMMRRLAERGARVGFVDAPQGRLRFAVRGRGPELLLLHGLGDSIAGWALIAGPLARRHQVHLLDLPGHGLSGPPPDWRLSTLAAAVAHYAQSLRTPLLVGHSLGGWIALRLALLGVVRPSGLTLINPAGALLAREEWAPFRQLVSAHDRAGATRYMKAAFHRPPIALRLFPGISPDLVRNVLRPPLQGLVLETYGVGNGPDKDEDFLAALKEASDRGVVIVDCTQCLEGTVNLSEYETGSALARSGVISGFDMTAEAALTKLYYLFSRGYSPDRVKREMQRDLRGEMTV